jgi:carbonic anhydrase
MTHPATSIAAFGAALLLGTAAQAGDTTAAWGYAGPVGPDRWGELASAYERCKTGMMQSPIDLADANAVGDIEVSVDYEPAPLVVMNNGKTVQAKFPTGSYMTSGGRVFDLIQVHFHTPSEHTLNGQYFPMVAHFVHATDKGELGVLGILFQEGPPNAELQKIIEAARVAGAEPREFPGVTLDPLALLPSDLDVWRYMGSLTTPPCSEGVNWHVAQETITASGGQLQAMAAMMGMNARPVQSHNHRLLVEPD